MYNVEDILNSSSTKVYKMENTPKPPNNGSKVKVKLKVAKRKVNIRRNSRFNRSNTSFNTSLNASKVMKKTLVANNRALADAVQISKHEIAVNTERIVNLQKENIELMLENGKLKHNLTHVIEDQVNDRVKPLIQLFKSKVCEVSIHLTDVASAIKELSSAVASQNKGFSNANSRANSVEIHQNLSNLEFTKRPSIEKTQKIGVDAPTLRRNSFNLSLIAESSYLNCDQSFDSFSTLDMVPENELDKCKTSNDITSLQNNIPPKRVSVEKRGSWLSRDSLNRRKSIKDEIDFGPHVAKNRKIRRSSFLFAPPLAYEKSLSPSPDPETPLKNDRTKNDEEQDDNFEKTVKTARLPNPTLMDADDDATILIDVPLSIKSMEVDTVYKEEEIKPQPSATSELNILQTPPADLVQQEEDLAPVENTNCPVTTNTLPLDNTQEINHTNVSEIDMELTEVINSSMQVGIEVSPFPVVQSTNEVKESAPAESLTTKDNNQDGAFLKPIEIPKAKTNSKKGEKKPSKKTKEKTKEAAVEDDGKAVVELRSTKPGKFIFSAVRKNTAGIRPSPPKARSKKKIAAMKKDELEAEPKNLFDFHDKTPQLLAKKPEVAADTGIYDVSLNDSVYGTCQSLGEYRERVALAKRINPVHSTDVPLNPAASASSVRNEVSANILETAAEVESEEKKNRARSKKTVNDDKRGRSRSRKRIEDSDGDSDLDNTYVKQYEKTAKSNIHVDATERQPARRARSKVISYKEVESDFDVTVTETIVPGLCLKNAKTKEKEAPFEESAAADVSKETKSNMLSNLNSDETESKTAMKKETTRKSLKETQEKRARSRKKSMTGDNTRKLESSDNLTLESTENSAPEKVPENKTPFELLNLMSRLEKLQKKQSSTQHNVEIRSGEESEDPVGTTSKSKSEDIFERYKRALTASNDSDRSGEMKQTESSRSRSRSRSRPARTESPKTMSLPDQCGRSRSLRAMKSKCDDDAINIIPKRRSRSVANKEQKSHESNSAGDMVDSMAEKYCSQSSGREEPKPNESKETDDNVNATSEKKRTRSVATKKTKSSASEDGLDHDVNPTPEKKRSRSVAVKKTKANASEDGVDHNVQSTPVKKRSRSVAGKKLRSDESKDIDDDVKTPDKKHRQSIAAKKLTSGEYHDINDKVISKPESKRSRSVAKKVNAASPPSSPLKKSAESPEVGRHQKVERGRSKSRANNDAKSKPAVPGARYSSVDKIKTSEGSPEILRQKQRVRSKGTFLKNDEDKVVPHIDMEAVNSETNSNHIKPVGYTVTGTKFKSSVADKENINTDVSISHMDTMKKSTKICQSESSHKEVKSASRISSRVSLTDAEDKTLSVFTRISSEKYPNSKRSAEYVTEENPDLKRPRRAIKPISYKELSIGKKLRQGDSFFSTEGIFHNGQEEESRKRSILDNVTNLHLH